MDVKRKSQKQEKRLAKQFNGRVTPGSGCIDNLKGDVRNDKFLIEAKYTTGNYVLKKSTWEKIAKEALKDGIREPLLQIDFVVSDFYYYSYIVMDIGFYLDVFKDVVVNVVEVEKSVTLKQSYFVENNIYQVICFGKLQLVEMPLKDFVEVIQI